MTSLLEVSPFASGGVYSGAWNGSAWLVGGTPDGIAVVQGTSVAVGPGLPGSPAGWVNAIVAVPGGWVVAGGRVLSGGENQPQLALVGEGSGGAVVDVSSELPTSFRGGWVQFAGWEEASSPALLLLAGIGGDQPSLGDGSGALAALSWPGGD